MVKTVAPHCFARDSGVAGAVSADVSLGVHSHRGRGRTTVGGGGRESSGRAEDEVGVVERE